MNLLRVLSLVAVTLALVAATFAVTAVRADEDRTSFIAHLWGANEIPARDTMAHGIAYFQLSEDGTTVRYFLIVSKIENVIASHIHIGNGMTNGPVVVFLYGPVAPGGGPINGLIASGSFTSANFVGPLAGHPMSDLLANMTSGNAYANVHTNDGVDPTNTGAGDFPGGEIRGQIEIAD